MFTLQIDEAVDQPQLDIYTWIGLQELSQRRRQVPTPEWRRGVDADPTFRCAVQRRRFGTRQMQFLHDAPGALGKGQCRRHRPHGMGAAAEQLTAEGLLQCIDTPCHGRGREAMPARSSGEAAAFQHVEEEFELSGKGVWQHWRLCLCVKCKAIVRGCAYRRQP